MSYYQQIWPIWFHYRPLQCPWFDLDYVSIMPIIQVLLWRVMVRAGHRGEHPKRGNRKTIVSHKTRSLSLIGSWHNLLYFCKTFCSTLKRIHQSQRIPAIWEGNFNLTNQTEASSKSIAVIILWHSRIFVNSMTLLIVRTCVKNGSSFDKGILIIMNDMRQNFL